MSTVRRGALRSWLVSRGVAFEATLATALGVLWVTSLVRVLGAVHRHEVFGSEATLALLVVALVPKLIYDCFDPARSRPQP
jgi:hypothetical protein